jgi:Low psii accumulation1 / Rep27
MGAFFSPTLGYVPATPVSRHVGQATTRIAIPKLLARSLVSSPFRLHAASDDQKKNKRNGGLDESVRTKLVSESIAPWRTLRLFLYFSLGSGALVGGLITLTGLAAVLSGAKEGDVNTEVCFLTTVDALHCPD